MLPRDTDATQTTANRAQRKTTKSLKIARCFLEALFGGSTCACSKYTIDMTPKMWLGKVPLLDESGRKFDVALKLEFKYSEPQEQGSAVPAVCALPTSSPLPHCRPQTLASIQLPPLTGSVCFS
jgi:hypothetical protein